MLFVLDSLSHGTHVAKYTANRFRPGKLAWRRNIDEEEKIHYVPTASKGL